ncbi:MAG: NAD kinase [Nocardioides sp.]|uniref:NAD kinase n=1 Tax=Nocardioides sp. TaxID=35761 RepID=UPI0039E70FE5
MSAPTTPADLVRRVLVLTHTGRAEALSVAMQFTKALQSHGILVRMVAAEAAALGVDADGVELGESAEDCELVLVIGGDGSILRAAEITHGSNTPVLGVNLGHVGFLAEAEVEDVETVLDAIVHRTYTIEDRLALDVRVTDERGAEVFRTFAVNEASVEKAARERMLEVVIEVDDRPLSRFGCDGVVCATPTGSTAYNFSAGGPIVWPSVEALLMVPLSAHALFARPLVISPTSTLAVEVIRSTNGAGVLWCDGRRAVDLAPGARIEVTRGDRPVRLVRLHEAPFTDRLVAKFQLPVEGWRGASDRSDRGRDEARA